MLKPSENEYQTTSTIASFSSLSLNRVGEKYCFRVINWIAGEKTTCRIIFSQETRTINLRFKTTIHKNRCMKVSTIVEIHFVFFLGTSWDQLRGKCKFSMSFLSFDCLKISPITTNRKRREPMRTENKIMKAGEKCNR